MENNCLNCSDGNCSLNSMNCNNYKPLCCINSNKSYDEIINKSSKKICKFCKYYDKDENICRNNFNYTASLDEYHFLYVSEYDYCPNFEKKYNLIDSIKNFFKKFLF